jgi:hypothetical protein
MDSMTTSKLYHICNSYILRDLFLYFQGSEEAFGKKKRVAVQGEMAQAIIVDNATSKDLDGVTYYHPVITFRTASSQAVTVQSQEWFYH